MVYVENSSRETYIGWIDFLEMQWFLLRIVVLDE